MKKLKLDELNRLSPEEYKAAEKAPIVVVLDNVRSLHNVGSIFRTSDAFRVQNIYLCGITGTPPNKEINKTALGATESVDWNYFTTTIEAMQQLKQTGYTVYAIEQAEGSIDLQNLIVDKTKPIAFVFGNEVEGVSEEVMQLIDACIEIPQFGSKHSFNVSVTAGIVLWHYHYLSAS